MLQLDSLGLPDATPVREALRGLHSRVINGKIFRFFCFTSSPTNFCLR